jgi:hypothetical protein
VELFLCHTPLHVLISLLVAAAGPRTPRTFAVVEDSAGLHQLARLLVQADSGQLHLLPGVATATNLLSRTRIQRNNAKILRSLYADTAETVHLFHDLRAESQSLLNTPSISKRTRFILLEDGIALYEPRGLLVGGWVSVLKRKLAFGMTWKHARELGLHPALSEIRCFYPHLLRTNLRHKPSDALPISLHLLLDNATLAALRPTTMSAGARAVIAVPHSRSVSPAYFQSFLEASTRHCEKMNLNPLFKLHPNDTEGLALLQQQTKTPELIPQELPLELALIAMDDVTSFVGARTSALHIVKKLCPQVSCLFFESADTEVGRKWLRFFEQAGIPAMDTNR